MFTWRRYKDIRNRESHGTLTQRSGNAQGISIKVSVPGAETNLALRSSLCVLFRCISATSTLNKTCFYYFHSTATKAHFSFDGSCMRRDMWTISPRTSSILELNRLKKWFILYNGRPSIYIKTCVGYLYWKSLRLREWKTIAYIILFICI